VTRTVGIASSVAAVVLGACALDPPAPLPLPTGDARVFAGVAQPALDRRCVDGGCHANPARPFAIYSAGRRRADSARLHLIEPLTDHELAANARALAAFALEPLAADLAIDACLVLCKPLAVGAGGCGHVVGEIFTGTDDRDYQGLHAYLATLTMPEAP
jgi:hypothetical protein